MGEAYVALADDAGGIVYNPAGMVAMHRNSVQFTHTAWFKDSYMESLYIVRAIRPSFFMGGIFSVVGLPTQQLTSAAAPNPDPLQSFDVLGSFNPFDLRAGVAIASQLGDNWKLGGNLNVTSQSIASSMAVGLGLDLGVIWATPIRKLNLGLSAQNMGFSVPLYKESFGLPFYARLGASYQAHPRALFSLEADMPGDNAFGGSIGAEFNRDHLVFFRTGWRYDNIFNPVSLGMGFKVGNSMLDLVWVPAGELGHTYRLSLALNWGGWAAENSVVELWASKSVIDTRGGGGNVDLQGLVDEPEQAEAWSLSISPLSGGAPVQIFSGTGAPSRALQWDGKGKNGAPVAEGSYQAKLQVRFRSGETVDSEGKLLLVNPAMPEMSLEIGSNSVDPHLADSAYVPIEFHFKAGKTAVPYRYRVEISSATDGALFQKLEGDLIEDNAVTWNGYNDQGQSFTSNSTYRFKLLLIDASGHVLKEFNTVSRLCVFRS
jgi:hypothetical protein